MKVVKLHIWIMCIVALFQSCSIGKNHGSQVADAKFHGHTGNYKGCSKCQALMVHTQCQELKGKGFAKDSIEQSNFSLYKYSFPFAYKNKILLNRAKPTTTKCCLPENSVLQSASTYTESGNRAKPADDKPPYAFSAVFGFIATITAYLLLGLMYLMVLGGMTSGVFFAILPILIFFLFLTGFLYSAAGVRHTTNPDEPRRGLLLARISLLLIIIPAAVLLIFLLFSA